MVQTTMAAPFPYSHNGDATAVVKAGADLGKEGPPFSPPGATTPGGGGQPAPQTPTALPSVPATSCRLVDYKS